MAASDVLFLPSRWEGIALSVYEAMACGLAVVTADVGGHRELVTPDCGRLVAVGDEEAQAQEYADILVELIRNEGTRQAMGQSARKRVQKSFGMDTMGDRMVELIEGAADLRRQAAQPPTNRGTGLEFATLGIEYLRLQDLATYLWQDRELRLGMRKTWRSRVLGLAYRTACRFPPRPRAVLARIYRRWFMRV
jgi:hypothetical protein